jgi:PAS domain S-box-containing protein
MSPDEPSANSRAQVLIVEDERLIGLDIQRTLERQGYPVVGLASRGEHAIEMAREGRPDVVLMDIRLKGDVDGIYAAREIRQRFDIPVIFLTAHADEATLQRAVATDAFGYLLKPFQERELFSTIEIVCFKHRLEKQLRDNQQWLATTLESIGDGIIATDEHGCIRLMNPVAERLTGWTHSAALGQPLSAVLTVVDPRTRQPTVDPFSSAQDASGPVMAVDSLLLPTGSGRETPVDLITAPLRDGDGRLVGVVVTLHDITERRRWEERLAAVNEVGRELTLLRNSRLIPERVLDVAARVIAFDRALYGVWDETAGEMQCQYYRDDGRPEGDIWRLGQADADRIEMIVIRSGEAVNIPDTGSDARCAAGVAANAPCAAVYVPMKVGTRTVGILAAERRTREPFSATDQQLLQTLAHQTAIALENARLYDEIEDRVEELAALNRIGQAINSSLEWQATLNVVAEQARRLLDVAAVSVALVEEGSGDVRYAAAAGEKSDFIPGRRLPAGQGIVGWVVQHGKPAVVPEVTQDERFFAEFDRLSGFTTRSILCVPLQVDGRTIGAIQAINKSDDRFDHEDMRLLTALAAPAATAIANARWFEQVRASRKLLQTLSHRFVQLQESERRLIAREIHDEAGQALTSLMVGLRLLEERAARNEPLVDHIADLKQTVDQVLEGLHRLATDLRPASLDHLGLCEALRQYVHTFSQQHRLAVQFETIGLEDDSGLPPEEAIALYRIAQEALTNVVRHSNATRADVLLERRANQLVLIVEDNGTGFEPAEVTAGDHLGLAGMQERAEMVGGSLVIESSPGSGTTVYVELPYVVSDSHR